MRHFLWIFLMVGLLTACAGGAKEPSLYHWGSYPNSVYQGMSNNMSPDEQLDILNQYLDESQVQEYAVAPGVHAQMGMLYTLLGQSQQAEDAFIEEKNLFPEAERFMGFLLKKPTVSNGEKP